MNKNRTGHLVTSVYIYEIVGRVFFLGQMKVEPTYVIFVQACISIRLERNVKECKYNEMNVNIIYLCQKIKFYCNYFQYSRGNPS